MRGSLQRSVESSLPKGDNVIILGAILMILGFVFGIPILWTVGIVLLVVGLVLMLLGRGGRQIGGRAHYY
jgi:uncharacterized membrane protein